MLPGAGSVDGGRELDREDFALEQSRVDRRDRTAVRLERVGVQRLAAEPPLLGEQLGRDALRDDVVAVGDEAREVAAVRPHRDARHHLHAGGDDDVELSCGDRGRGVQVRLHRRAALTVDGRPRDVDRPAGGQHGHPADVPALFADLRHAAHLHVVDPARVEADPLDEPVQHLRREGVAAQRCERSVPASDRRAHGVDDVRVHCRQL